MRVSHSQNVFMKLALSQLLAIQLLAPADLLSQQPRQKVAFGVAWRVIGAWRVEGAKEEISEGDALQPGSLLRPAEGARDHSITILLPDGQRILYECFASRDCARGFRVPSLFRKPVSTAIDLLARVNAVSQQKQNSHTVPEQPDDSAVPRDEAVSLIGSDNDVEVAGLASALSDGTYSYITRSLTRSSDKPARGFFEKRGRAIKFPIPSEGLFDVSIYDRANSPRMDLLLAAVHQPRGARTVRSFEDVEALLKDWNEDYQGWPIHEFRRSYLRSIILGIEPPPFRVAKSTAPSERTEATNVACEPGFSPAPGVFKTDTEVTLRCSNPGATMRYTVDGSQPLDGAAIYRSPIVVKGTALTIKAFASEGGKKDSPVVTGIFRIGD